MKAALNILNLEDNANDAELNTAMITARWPLSQLLRVDTREKFMSAITEEKFDLILSDYTLSPGFNGLDALTIAREKCPGTPFLFVSGTIGEDAAIEALKNGATDYVLKHRLMRLIPVVDRALREADERAECERAEEAMRQSEHKYRELFECLGDAAFLAEESTGKIIDVNRQAENLLGCRRAEILGRTQSQFLKVPDAESGNTSAAVPEECKLICADGTIMPVAVRGTPITLYGRNLVLRLCHLVD